VVESSAEQIQNIGQSCNIIQLNNKKPSNIIINKQTNKQINNPVKIFMNYGVYTNKQIYIKLISNIKEKAQITNNNI